MHYLIYLILLLLLYLYLKYQSSTNRPIVLKCWVVPEISHTNYFDMDILYDSRSVKSEYGKHPATGKYVVYRSYFKTNSLRSLAVI